MIYSMTGFASRTILLPVGENEKALLSLSLKALNARFFEIHCRLPHALNHLETKCISLFKKHLVRGNIYFTAHVSNPNVFKGSVSPSLSLAQEYCNAIEKLKSHTKISGEITLENLLHLPNIFGIEEQVADERATKLLLEATAEMVEKVIEERAREGVSLEKDLRSRIAVLQQHISDIEAASQEHVEAQKQKMHALSAELKNDTGALADAQKSALFIMLDKIDVHEEIVRFKSHLDNLEIQLDSPEREKGKRIDFTLQELAREINTIAAKCSDATIGKLAVSVKVEIEKAREQAQNIV